MVTSLVLMSVERDSINAVAEKLVEIDGVSEVFSVAGQYDLVAMIRVPSNEALADAGYVYDASTVSRGPARPDVGAPIRFSLPTIPEGPKSRRIIAMDYNLFVRHSGGVERTAKSAEFEERAYQAFTRAFEEQYRGPRVPLQIGFHFTLMNDAAYWRALERFATDVCGRSEVRCVSYRTLAHILRHDDSTASVAPGN